MVRDYERKTNRQSWSTESMDKAVSAVIDEKLSFNKAATQYGVPQTTLERHVRKRREMPSYVIDKKAGKFQCVFEEQQELELVDYLKNMEKRLFGLTMQDCRKMAYELAERNGCAHRFNKLTRMAGQDWMNGFLSRHPDLSLRKPEPTSGARAMGFNKVAVTQFFELLTETLDKYQLTGSRMFNCDETAVTVNSKGNSKVLATKGKRQVGVLTSAERGETVTAELCFSAAGAYMPPMLIFPRKRKQKEFEIGLPPGSWAEVHETGWMTSDIFVTWFRKFIEFSNSSKDSPVLLLLDGHVTHTKNLEVIDLARQNGVILLCFPPHCSHRLQPLDVSFMKPVSLRYEEEVRKWQRCNPGKMVTLWQISSLFGAAFVTAATMKTALNGFKKTGIWPPDMKVFSESDFLPSATTDIEIRAPSPVILDAPVNGNSCEKTAKETTGNKNDSHVAQPQCSWMPDSITDIEIPRPSSFPNASPENLMPIPKVKQGEKRVARKRGKTAILTSSPYRAELQSAIDLKKSKMTKAKGSAKKKLFKSKEVESMKTTRKIKKNRIQKKTEEITEEFSSSESDDTACLYCSDFYSTSNEGWIACVKCKRWSHNSCAGIDSEDDETVLICEYCK